MPCKTGNDSNSEAANILWRSTSSFPQRRLFSFLNFMKKKPNIKNASLGEGQKL